MPVFENHTGINFSETKLQLVELSYKNNTFCLENVDQSIFKERLVPEIEESKLIAILQESFNKITSRKPLAAKFVSFTLPNNYFNIFEIPFDHALTKKDLLQHFKWELSVLYPDSPEDGFYIQHVDVNKSTVRTENKAIVFALRKDIVALIHKFCKANNLELKYVDNAHLASNAFLYMNKTFLRSEIVFSLYIDQNYSSFTAIEGINPFYFKVFDSDGPDIFEEFEAVIQKMHEFKIDFASVKELLLCGQSITKDFENRIKEKFNIPVKKINPFERLQVESELKKSPHFTAQFNSFTAATGIAIRII
jgi:Tfp pilus assembly PilM family ATPase